MAHRDHKRHRGERNRPMEHRLAGGHHRTKSDGCLSAFIGLAAAAGAMVLGAGYGVAQVIGALV